MNLWILPCPQNIILNSESLSTSILESSKLLLVCTGFAAWAALSLAAYFRGLSHEPGIWRKHWAHALPLLALYPTIAVIFGFAAMRFKAQMDYLSMNNAYETILKVWADTNPVAYMYATGIPILAIGTAAIVAAFLAGNAIQWVAGKPRETPVEAAQTPERVAS